jgi:hypothetical protein
MAPEGYDAVIGNPPWEKVKLSRHEFLKYSGAKRHYGAQILGLDEERFAQQRVEAAVGLDALHEVAPQATRGQAAWCYQFALGALLHHISDSRMDRLSRGENADSDPAAAHLLARFIEGGVRAMLAPATPVTASRNPRLPAAAPVTTTLSTRRHP